MRKVKPKSTQHANRTACKHKSATQPWPPNSTGVNASPLYNLPSMYNVLQNAVTEVEEELNHASRPQIQSSGDPADQQQRAGEISSNLKQHGGKPGHCQAARQGMQQQSITRHSETTTFITQPDEINFLASDPRANTSPCAPQSRRQHLKCSQLSQQKTFAAEKTSVGQGEIRLIPNAPNISPAGRAVHPLFLAGTLLNGLPTTASHHISGERPKRSSKACVTNPQPRDWTTDDLVTNCIRPALGATRVSYVQALACGAVEVSWCPDGRFKSNLFPPSTNSPIRHSGKSSITSALPSQTQRQPSSCGRMTQQPCEHTENHNNHNSKNNTTSIKIPLIANAMRISGCNQAVTGLCQQDYSWEVPIPTDLEGKLAYGPATYYMIHAWRETEWAQLVTAILHHYLCLPEVAASGGTRFVPVYYWLDIFAVPQYERPCPEFKRPEPVIRSILSTCQAALLTAQPWDAPAALSRAWCLFELFLTREVGRELQVLLLDKLPVGVTSSDSFLDDLLSIDTAAHISCSSADKKGASIAAVSVIDGFLQGLSVNTAGTRVAIDKAMLTEAVDDPTDFDAATRKYARTHMLTALLSACLRRAGAGCWNTALGLINEGAFLQWPSPNLAIDCGSPAGSADEAAAFLGAALQTCSPHVLSAWSQTHSSNPIQELVFLPPSEPLHLYTTNQTICKPVGSVSHTGTSARASTPNQQQNNKNSTPRNLTDAARHNQDVIDRSIARANLQEQSPRRRSSRGQHAECLLSSVGVNSLSQGLTGNIHLVRLVLSSHPIGDAGIEALVEALTSQPTALQQLKLRNCGLGSDAGELLAVLLGDVHSCQLRQLDLGSNPGLGGKGVQALAQGLVYNKHLRVLKLDGCEAGTEAAAALVTALTQQLDNCAGCPVHHNAQEKQTSSPRESKDGHTGYGIWCLDLQNNGIGVQAGRAVAQLLAHPSCALNQLYLGYNLLETQGVLPILKALKANSSLQVLQLRCNHLALEIGAALSEVLSMSNPNNCNASSVYKGQDSRGLPHPMSDMQQAARDQHMCSTTQTETRRSMSGTPSSATPVYDIHSHGHPLQQLDLGENPMLGDVGVELLAEGLQKTGNRCQLKGLILDGVDCGVRGVTALARAIACVAIETAPTVQEPAASMSGVSAGRQTPREGREIHNKTVSKVQRQVSEVLAFGNGLGVQHIDLSNNPLGKEGAIALAGALPHAYGLKTLILQNCMMDVDGRLALLTSLQLNSSCLKQLNMRNNGQDPATYIPNSTGQAADDSQLLRLCTYEMTLAQSLTLARQLTAETGIDVEMASDQ